MSLELQRISFSYRSAAETLSSVSLSMDNGSFWSLLGESGAGKTTLLKIISGLLAQRQGHVFVDGILMDDTPAHLRRIGYIFQDLRLFPHMAVAENVSYGLRIHGVAERDARRRALEWLDRVHLIDLADALPTELSGGQQQRVAIARALAMEPRLLLLDEPFRGLHERLKEDIKSLIGTLHSDLGVAMLLVTHDAEDALELSDGIAFLENGRIIQHGSPREIYEDPASLSIAAGFGGSSLIRGMVHSGRFYSGDLTLPAPKISDGAAVAVIRSETVSFEFVSSDTARTSNIHPHLIAPVRTSVFKGGHHAVTVDIADQVLTFASPHHIEPGTSIALTLDTTSVPLFPEP